MQVIGEDCKNRICISQWINLWIDKIVSVLTHVLPDAQQAAIQHSCRICSFIFLYCAPLIFKTPSECIFNRSPFVCLCKLYLQNLVKSLVFYHFFRFFLSSKLMYISEVLSNWTIFGLFFYSNLMNLIFSDISKFACRFDRGYNTKFYYRLSKITHFNDTISFSASDWCYWKIFIKFFYQWKIVRNSATAFRFDSKTPMYFFTWFKCSQIYFFFFCIAFPVFNFFISLFYRNPI